MKLLLIFSVFVYYPYAQPAHASQTSAFCVNKFMHRLKNIARPKPAFVKGDPANIQTNLETLKIFNINPGRLSKTSTMYKEELSKTHPENLKSALSHITEFIKKSNYYYDYPPSLVFTRIINEEGLLFLSTLTYNQPEVLYQMNLSLSLLYGEHVKIRQGKLKKSMHIQEMLLRLLMDHPRAVALCDPKKLKKVLIFLNHYIGKKHTLNLFIDDPLTFMHLSKKHFAHTISFLEKQFSKDWVLKQIHAFGLRFLLLINRKDLE